MKRETQPVDAQFDAPPNGHAEQGKHDRQPLAPLQDIRHQAVARVIIALDCAMETEVLAENVEELLGRSLTGAQARHAAGSVVRQLVKLMPAGRLIQVRIRDARNVDRQLFRRGVYALKIADKCIDKAHRSGKESGLAPRATLAILADSCVRMRRITATDVA